MEFEYYGYEEEIVDEFLEQEEQLQYEEDMRAYELEAIAQQRLEDMLEEEERYRECMDRHGYYEEEEVYYVE